MAFATGCGRTGDFGAAGFAFARVLVRFGVTTGFAVAGAPSIAMRTVKSALQTGQRTFFPCRLLVPLNFFAQCEHWITQATGAAAACGAAFEAAPVAFCGDETGVADAVALLALANGGIETTALHAGHATRFPANSSGALSFFEHFAH